jgi:Trk-type K+ transport system membrane component
VIIVEEQKDSIKPERKEGPMLIPLFGMLLSGIITLAVFVIFVVAETYLRDPLLLFEENTHIPTWPLVKMSSYIALVIIFFVYLPLKMGIYEKAISKKSGIIMVTILTFLLSSTLLTFFLVYSTDMIDYDKCTSENPYIAAFVGKGLDPSFDIRESFFDAVSGFTTTGLTAFNGTVPINGEVVFKVDVQPNIVHVIRAAYLLIGGLGIMFFYLYFTPVPSLMMSMGYEIQTERSLPRFIRLEGLSFSMVYIAVALVGVLLLYAFAYGQIQSHMEENPLGKMQNEGLERALERLQSISLEGMKIEETEEAIEEFEVAIQIENLENISTKSRDVVEETKRTINESKLITKCEEPIEIKRLESIEKLENALEDFTKSSEAFETAESNLVDAIERLKATIRGIEGDVKEGVAPSHDINEKLGEVEEDVRIMDKSVRNLEEATEGLRKAVGEVGWGIADIKLKISIEEVEKSLGEFRAAIVPENVKKSIMTDSIILAFSSISTGGFSSGSAPVDKMKIRAVTLIDDNEKRRELEKVIKDTHKDQEIKRNKVGNFMYHEKDSGRHFRMTEIVNSHDLENSTGYLKIGEEEVYHQGNDFFYVERYPSANKRSLLVIVILMFAGALPLFSLHRPLKFIKRWKIFTIFLLPVILVIVISYPEGFDTAFYRSFDVVSAFTTTGLYTSQFEKDFNSPLESEPRGTNQEGMTVGIFRYRLHDIFLIILMFIGGAAYSTAGGWGFFNFVCILWAIYLIANRRREELLIRFVFLLFLSFVIFFLCFAVGTVSCYFSGLFNASSNQETPAFDTLINSAFYEISALSTVGLMPNYTINKSNIYSNTRAYLTLAISMLVGRLFDILYPFIALMLSFEGES